MGIIAYQGIENRFWTDAFFPVDIIIYPFLPILGRCCVVIIFKKDMGPMARL